MEDGESIPVDVDKALAKAETVSKYEIDMTGAGEAKAAAGSA